MRLLTSLTAAALSGLAVASSQQSADVFVFAAKQPQQANDTPRLPKEVARHILLQRTSRDNYGSDLRDIPNTVDTETAVDAIARYGKSPAPLFASADDTTDPSQLIVILEGVTPENAAPLKEKLSESAAFTIADPPSAAANERLMTLFRNQGVASSTQCDIKTTINPFETNCWTGSSSVVMYDLRKSPETIQTLISNLPRLNKFTSTGDLEALLVLIPESARNSKIQHWSKAAAGAGSSDLRARKIAEAVISDRPIPVISANNAGADEPAVSAQNGNGFSHSQAPAHKAAADVFKSIPQCFNSLSSCQTQTGNCSGHGECVDKYGKTSEASCFSCRCKPTVVENKNGQQTTYWGGSTCQKKDVSVPFWLIVGFTVSIVGAISFAIGMLFSVGEEKLPGVIGAGVVRGTTAK